MKESTGLMGFIIALVVIVVVIVAQVLASVVGWVHDLSGYVQ